MAEANTNIFDQAQPGFNNSIYSPEMSFDGLAGNDLTGAAGSIGNLGSNIVGSNLGDASSQFGLGDLGSALGEGWDFLKGGLDTVSGLAGLYMDWDKLQSTKNSARDSHNASATQYNNYLNRAKSVSNSMGLSKPSNPRANVKKSTV